MIAKALKHPRLVTAIVMATILVTAGLLAHSYVATLTPLRYRFAQPQRTDQLEQRLVVLQERLRHNPDSGLTRASLASTYLAMAQSSGAVGWFLLAEQNALHALEQLPFYNTEAELVLAELAELRHDFPRAITMAEAMLVQDSSQPQAQAILVTSYLAQGRLSAAHSAASHLLEQLPTAESLALMALVEQTTGQDARAETLWQQAIAREDVDRPRHSAWMRTQLGKLYAKQGQHKAAYSQLFEALRLVPSYPLAELTLAEIWLVEGRFRKASQRYERLLFRAEQETGLVNHIALQGLARSKRLAGQEAAAEDLWQEAEDILRRDLAGSDFGHRRELAHLLLERGYPEDAAEALLLLQAEVRNRRDVQTLDLLAWAYERTADPDSARAISQEAIATGSSRPEILYRASQLVKDVNPELSSQLLEQATAINGQFDDSTWQALGLSAIP